MVLVRDLERRGITHLHNHFANSGATVGFLATRHLGMSWSLTLHGNSETDYPAGNLLPEKLAAADFVACVTHYGRAQAFRMISPALWHKLMIVRCGLELRALPSAARREQHSGVVRLICVARLVPEKGHVGLLQAFAKANVESAELVLVGDGSERAGIEATIAELGLGNRVQVRGRLPELETLEEIAKSAVLVLSSFVEGLPVVLMEALALSVPVVAPWVAGIPELVEHDVNGLMFAPARWDELAECLRRILTDAALRERLAGAGRAKIEREFEISRAVLPLVERYQAGKALVPGYAATPAADHVHG
jgi:glycosyltransferase involved in cell wall biosynthesis